MIEERFLLWGVVCFVSGIFAFNFLESHGNLASMTFHLPPSCTTVSGMRIFPPIGLAERCATRMFDLRLFLVSLPLGVRFLRLCVTQECLRWARRWQLISGFGGILCSNV